MDLPDHFLNDYHEYVNNTSDVMQEIIKFCPDHYLFDKENFYIMESPERIIELDTYNGKFQIEVKAQQEKFGLPDFVVTFKKIEKDNQKTVVHTFSFKRMRRDQLRTLISDQQLEVKMNWIVNEVIEIFLAKFSEIFAFK